MKVAAIQMVSSTDVKANCAAGRLLVAEAAAQGAELAVLPEYFCVMGFRDTDKLLLAEAQGTGPLQEFLCGCAREFGLWLVGGTIPLATGAATPATRAFNTTLVYGPQGQLVARYDKMHLFRLNNGQEQFDETRVLDAGGQTAYFDLPSSDGDTWRIGLSICYDLRFPELYRALRADLLLVPSAFTFTTGQAHWELLLRARAVENLAYVLAAAQGGTHENGRRTWGHSMVIGPWGDVLDQKPEGAGVVVVEISKARLAAARLRLPALDHVVL
jgi:predicted amidohydrolase